MFGGTTSFRTGVIPPYAMKPPRVVTAACQGLLGGTLDVHVWDYP